MLHKRDRRRDRQASRKLPKVHKIILRQCDRQAQINEQCLFIDSIARVGSPCFIGDAAAERIALQPRGRNLVVRRQALFINLNGPYDCPSSSRKRQIA